MATKNEIKIALEILLKDKNFKKKLTESENHMKKSAKKQEGFISRIKKSWLGITIALGGFVLAIRKVMKLTITHEKVVAKLNNALVTNGTATKEQVKELLKYNDTLQNTTGFSNDEITAAQAMLGTFKLTAAEIRKITPRLLDMNAAVESSTGTQQDLTQTALQLGKVFTGYESSLSRIGVTMTDAEKKSLKMATGMEKVNIVTKILDNNFKGTAETVGKTFGGQLKILTGTFDDFQKMIGKHFLKYLHPMVEKMNEFLQTEEGLRKIKNVVKGIVTGFLILKGAIVTVVNIFKPFIKAISHINEMMYVFNEQIKAKNYSAAFKVLSTGSKRVGDAFTDSFANIKNEWGNTTDYISKMYTELENDTLETTTNFNAQILAGQQEKAELEKEIQSTTIEELKEVEALAREERFENDIAEMEHKIMLINKYMQHVKISSDERIALQRAKAKIEMAINKKKNAEIIKFEGEMANAVRTGMLSTFNTYGSGIADMIVEGVKWRKNFLDLISDMLKAVAKLIIKLLVVKALKILIGGPLGLFSEGGKVPDYYAGGGKVAYAAAGMKPQGTDTVPAMLTPGERVLSVKQTNAFDELMRNMMMPSAGGTSNVNNNTTNEGDSIINNEFNNNFEGNTIDEMLELSQNTGTDLLRR